VRYASLPFFVPDESFWGGKEGNMAGGRRKDTQGEKSLSRARAL